MEARKMRFSISSLLLWSLVVGVALAWFMDHRGLEQDVAVLEAENAKLSVAHKDHAVRRQNVLSLIAGDPGQNIPLLITALADEDIRIAMEARAGLEAMTKVSFRPTIPNTATESDVRSLMREEQDQWERWYEENRQSL